MGCGASKQPPPPPSKYAQAFPTPKALKEAQRELIGTGHGKQASQNANPGETILPEPSVLRKQEIFNLQKCIGNQTQAIQAPPRLAFAPLTNLVNHLCKVRGNDVTKIWSFYVWIALQDVRSYDLDKPPSKDSAIYLLLMARGRAASKNDLFYQMCRLAGIPCKIITGSIKPENYWLGGEPVHGHTWCAVHVAGEWRLVDQDMAITIPRKDHIKTSTVNKGMKYGSSLNLNSRSDFKSSRSLSRANRGTILSATSRKMTTEMLPAKINEFYFLTDPDAFIFDHLPEEISWQLLARPVSDDEFIRMCFVRQGFFSFDVIDISTPMFFSETENGQVQITLDLPEHSSLYLSYTFQRLRGAVFADDIGGESLRDFVFVENTNGKKEITARCKEAGQYILKLYGTDMQASRPQTFELCHHLILCSEPQHLCTASLRNERYEYGPGVEMAKLDIQPVSHQSGKVITEDGKVTLTLHDDGAKEYYFTLESADLSKSSLKDYVRYYRDVDKTQVNFMIKTPQYGQYLFCIFARDCKIEGNYENICNYLVESDVGCSDISPFPPTTGSKIGQTTDTASLKLHPISHSCPIQQAQNDGTLTVRLGYSQALDIVTKLTLSTHHNGDHSDCVFDHYLDDSFTSEIRFPKAGLYTFTIFAKLRGRQELHREVWIYLINADYPMVNCLPFPSIEPSWSLGNYLIKPRDGYLRENTTKIFEFKVPKAADVTVLGDALAAYGTLKKGEDGVWTGSIDTGRGGRQMTVAFMAEGDDEYQYLLHYQVVSDEEMSEIFQHSDLLKQEAIDRLDDIKATKEQEKVHYEHRQRDKGIAVRKAEENWKLNQAQTVDFEKRLRNEADEIWNETKQKRETDANGRGISRSENEQADIIKQQIQQVKEESNADVVQRRKIHAGMRVKMVREQLREATRLKNRTLLEQSIKTFSNQGLAEESGDFWKAETTLEVLVLKQRLSETVSRRDIDSINETIDNIHTRGYFPRLQQDVQDAERFVRSLLKIERLKLAVTDMDKNTMREIKSYSNPPDTVKKVMVATFLLLGIDEETTSDWQEVKKLCTTFGKDNLSRRLLECDLEAVHPEIMARAKQIFEQLDFRKVQLVSAGAASFYVWGMGSIDEIEQIRKVSSSDEGIKPAGVYRQKEILGRLPPPDKFTPRTGPPAKDYFII